MLKRVMIVSRRVIRPLRAIRDAMLRVAAGDRSADDGCTERNDEITALTGALRTLKRQAIEEVRIDRQHHERAAGAPSIEAHIEEFESQVREALSQLRGASNAMRKASDGMSAVCGQTNPGVEIAAKASDEASTNVQDVASAAAAPTRRAPPRRA